METVCDSGPTYDAGTFSVLSSLSYKGSGVLQVKAFTKVTAMQSLQGKKKKLNRQNHIFFWNGFHWVFMASNLIFTFNR